MKKNKETIIKAVSSNDNIQFFWTMLSVDIIIESHAKSHATQLLEEIIGLWITIRGFSIADGWLEQYKQVNKTAVSKTKPLRKALKRKSTSTSDT